MTTKKKPKKASPKKPSAKKESPSKALAHLMAQAAYDTKALDLVVLDLTKVSAFADYFVIATGTSDRQVQAIADNIEKAVKAKGTRILGVEGYQKGHWVLIDCGSVIAHIFYEEARVFYGLEKLWGDAPLVRFKLT